VSQVNFTQADQIAWKRRVEGAKARLNSEVEEDGRNQLSELTEGLSPPEEFEFDPQELTDPFEIADFILRLPLHILSRATRKINDSITMETLLDNQAISESLMEGGIIGDISTREEYERTRLLHLSALPYSLKNVLMDFLANALVKGDFLGADLDFLDTKNFRKTVSAIKSDVRKSVDRHDDLMVGGYFLSRTFLTYDSMTRGLAYIEDNLAPFDRDALQDTFRTGHMLASTEDEIFEHLKIFNESLLPISASKAGSVARNTCKEFYTKLLKATILTDYIRLRGFLLTDRQLIDIWNSYSDPWGIRNSKPIENIRKCQIYLATKHPELSHEEQMEIATRYMFAADPIAKVENLLKPRATNSSTKPTVSKEEVLVTKSFKESLLDSFATLIKTYLPNDDDPKELVGFLYERYKRSHSVTYDTILNAFRSSSNRSELLAQLPLEKVVVPAVEMPSVSTDKTLQPKPIPKDQIEVYFHRGDSGQAQYQEWLETITDPTYEKRIQQSIEKFRVGIGDAKQLQDSCLSELRIHIGPGYRVYYVRIKNRAVILGGGKKDDQNRDMVYFENIAKGYIH